MRHDAVIEPLPSVLELVNSLNPVTFTYKQGIMPKEGDVSEKGRHAPFQFQTATQVGFIAQDLDSELARTVFHDDIVHPAKDNGYMSISDGDLLPILTKAIQEQQAEINGLQQKVEQLSHQK